MIRSPIFTTFVSFRSMIAFPPVQDYLK
jgi:hypothetical protein